mgnify:CR=1 FL=1
MSGCIHRAAGRELLKECMTLAVARLVRVCNQYRLTCFFVNVDESQLLVSCYKTALDIAKEKNIKSIAFPCISTGVYGYPKAEAA